MRISDWSSDVCSSDLFRLAAKPERERGNVGQLHRALDRRMAAKNLFDQRRSGARHAEDEDGVGCRIARSGARGKELWSAGGDDRVRSEEHTSELQSLMRISYAVFCLKKKTQQHRQQTTR